MSSGREKNIDVFAADVAKLSGYAYTRGDRFSSRCANERLSRAVREISDLKDKTVIDVGCGDGTYTQELLALGPKHLLGIDASGPAVEAARKKLSHLGSHVEFRTLSIYDLGQLGQQYDIAVVRGVLHHLYDAERGIAALLSVAKEVIVIEPNGYNPVLKAIERLSRYHVEHEEKSYPPFRLREWFEKRGGKITRSFYAGLVPFFCPDGFAKLLKAMEPWIEDLPWIRTFACGVYVFKVTRTANAPALMAPSASYETEKVD